MANYPLRSQPLFRIFLLLVLLLLHPPSTRALNFTFSSFDINQTGDLIFDGNATISGAAIDLTAITNISPTNSPPLNPQFPFFPLTNLSAGSASAGRVVYREALQLWESDGNGTTKILTDFSTHFSFEVSANRSTSLPSIAHGLAFFLVPENGGWFPEAQGGFFGLFESEADALYDTSNKQAVAVEFDTFSDAWDPVDEHIGIDVNSIKSQSFVPVPDGILNRGTAHVWVTYHSITKNLSAHLSFEGSLGSYTVWYVVDLSDVLPPRVQVGFTATTTIAGAISPVSLRVFSWSFESNPNDAISPGSSSPKWGVFVGIGLAGFFVMVLISAILVFCYKSRRKVEEADQILFDDLGMTKFTYSQLSRATNNFAKERKLGSGGFGDVYEGVLTSPKIKVAVKRFRSGSNQGEKEYVSEVKVISRLRHRNIVSLVGWSHDHGELLLVYEFMPNRSLDFHLCGGENVLPWPTRYSIALGLASAVHYLHEEGDQCVVHRDIKSSNVMLDSDFNARLGDFGLARFTDHGQSLKTTVPAGTLAYLAPECLKTGKASKESDIYSFGIVALEITCGRKPIEPLEEDPGKVSLVEWVVNLHARGFILEAIDKRLDVEFDEDQARRLMVVGLWCCNPDPSQRPSMKQAISALEAPLPSLLQVTSMPMNYSSPGMDVFPNSYGNSYNIDVATKSSHNNTSSTASSSSQSIPKYSS